MKTYLLDADAFRCLRDLSLLRLLASMVPEHVSLCTTEYIGRHELSMISREVEQLQRDGKLTIHPVLRGTETFRRARALKAERLDPGEAEAIAWLLDLSVTARPLFVSNDRRAREGATKRGVSAGDLMDVVTELVDAGLLSESDAADKLSVWSDKSQMLCRPRDFTTFEELLLRRRQRGPLR